MNVSTGLDTLVRENFARLRGKSLGLLCNQASLSHDFRHILDLLLPLHQRGELRLASVMGPQHGLFGHTQDNMIEWEGSADPRTGLLIHSLYGEAREPSAAMLEGVELMVIDLQDVGARYYTFIWSMALTMKACAARGIPVMVLDRPNPIGGTQIEGNVLEPEFASFVGLHPLPARHGMTIGEIARYLQATQAPDLNLEVVAVQGWDRQLYMDETDATWGMPSPNMPTVNTAVVYPGGCLLEATNLSEARGTTRPFEILGAPYLDGWKYADAMNGLKLPGVYFRPLQFEPTFHKHAKTLCEGLFLHVTSRATFLPVITYVALLQEAIRQAPNDFGWKGPPYEYIYHLLPIDILAGNGRLRPDIESLRPLKDIQEEWTSEVNGFDGTRRNALLYD